MLEKIETALLKFFEKIYDISDSNENSEQLISEALETIVDELHLGEVRIKLFSPETRIRKEKNIQNLVLYSSDEKLGEDVYEVRFPISDGGYVEVRAVSTYGRSFTEDEKYIIKIVFNAIFIQISRMNMNRLLVKLLNYDIETEANTMDYTMRYAAELISTNKIQDYWAVFLNIHNFKYVNKVFAYSEGDKVLKKYTSYVKDKLQDKGILTRLGGDNFVILVKAQFCREILDIISSVRIQHEENGRKKEFVFGATVGYSDLLDVHEPREIMARVSLAYAAARRKGAGFQVEYTKEIRQQMMYNQSVLANLTEALENREFVVFYQPKVNIQNNSICGAEALARWKRKGEIIYPGQFIPLLEQEGGIIKLDYYVLENVCMWLRERIDRGEAPICISINFSRRHLEEDNFVGHVIEIIDKYDIEHKYIEVELTESEDYQNFEIMTEIINSFKNYGISTSMDDFGTGFSSLNMIKQVDLSIVKIDKSFIPRETEYDDKGKDIIMFNHIVDLIRELGKKTVAEGVETREQMEFLRDSGCDIVQGFVFDKPLPVDEFEERLQKGY